MAIAAWDLQQPRGVSQDNAGGGALSADGNGGKGENENENGDDKSTIRCR